MLHLNSCVSEIVGEYEVEIWDGDHLARLVNSCKRQRSTPEVAGATVLQFRKGVSVVGCEGKKGVFTAPLA